MYAVSSSRQGADYINLETQDIADIISGSQQESEGASTAQYAWLASWDNLDAEQGVTDELKLSRLFFRDLTGMGKLGEEASTDLARFEEQLRVLGMVHRCKVMRRLDERTGCRLRSEVIDKLIRDNAATDSPIKGRIVRAMQLNGTAELQRHYSATIDGSLLQRLAGLAEKVRLPHTDDLSLYEAVLLKIINVSDAEDAHASLAQYFFMMAEEVDAAAQQAAGDCHVVAKEQPARQYLQDRVQSVTVKRKSRSMVEKMVSQVASASLVGFRYCYSALWSSVGTITAMLRQQSDVVPALQSHRNDPSNEAPSQEVMPRVVEIERPAFLRTLAMFELETIAQLLNTTISLQIDDHAHLIAGNYQSRIELSLSENEIVKTTACSE